jgi:hypothetical protein
MGQASNIMNGNDIFDELFVLELANNHLGDLHRGLKIINNYAQVVRFNNVRAAIKLQLRDVDSFIHQDFRQREDIRYIKKTLDTRLQPEDFVTMVRAIREASCIPMATPFDEKSVDFCCELGIPILKIASSDCNDWICYVYSPEEARPHRPGQRSSESALAINQIEVIRHVEVSHGHQEPRPAAQQAPAEAVGRQHRNAQPQTVNQSDGIQGAGPQAVQNLGQPVGQRRGAGCPGGRSPTPEARASPQPALQVEHGVRGQETAARLEEAGVGQRRPGKDREQGRQQPVEVEAV